MELNPSAITALADLIAPNEESDSEDDMPSSYYSKLTPGNIGPPKNDIEEPSTKLNTKQIDDKDIWAQDEVNEGSQYDDTYDTRISPEYDIVYKQAVGAEDMFLGMGNKTPATASCEDMIIKVKLPGAIFKEVNVDLTDKHLSVRSPKYRLALHLPHSCDSKNGRAQWITDQETLNITVRMKREYDFVNF